MWPRATCLDLSVPQLPHLRHGGSDGLPHRAAVRTEEERHMKTQCCVWSTDLSGCRLMKSNDLSTVQDRTSELRELLV